jgi:hypothetical protein
LPEDGPRKAIVRPPEEATTEEEASEPDEDAGDFLKEFIEQRALGQVGRAWETLHPLHQEVATRNEYMDCEGQNTPSFELKGIEEVDEYDEPLQIPGQTGEVPSKAVTLRLEYQFPGAEDTQTETLTAHALNVDGEWRWVLAPDVYEAYKAGECLSAEE